MEAGKISSNYFSLGSLRPSVEPPGRELGRASEGGQSPPPRSYDDIKKAAKEFESYFISYLLKNLRETVPTDSLFGGGRGEEIYRSFQDEEFAKRMVESGGIGLSDIIIRDLSQGLASPPPPAKPDGASPSTLTLLAGNTLKTLKSNGDPADKGIADNISINKNWEHR